MGTFDLEAEPAPILDFFHWRRIVVDEGHEFVCDPEFAGMSSLPSRTVLTGIRVDITNESRLSLVRHWYSFPQHVCTKW